MSDKTKNSHIERPVYVACELAPGGSIRYGNWEDNEERARRCAECYGSGTVQNRNSWRDERCEFCRGTGRVKPLPLTLIDYACGSDYSGTLVEHSNAECLREKFPWLVEVYGGHGTFGVAYLGKRENQNPELIEAIDALCSYPLFDEDHHSNLEMEKVDEAWNDDGRKDWKRALVKFFDALLDEDHEHDEDKIDDASADQLWYDCTEKFRGGEDHLNEQGDQIYFPIDDVIEAIEKRTPASGVARWKGLDEITYSHDNRSIREKLNAMCDACRVTETESADASNE